MTQPLARDPEAASRSWPLLLLFDMDGTILLDDDYAGGRAMAAGIRAVWGVDIPDDAVRQIRPWGKTDVQIAREIAGAAGLADSEVDAGLERWTIRTAELFAVEARASVAKWRVRERAEGCLERLIAAAMRPSLLTGNLRPIAELKLDLMGLLRLFDTDVGAYGSDAEARADLVPIARARAGSKDSPWPAGSTVVIGDTPRDVAAARANGVRSIIFSSSVYSATDLTDADAIVDDADALAETLLAWDASVD